MKLPSNAARNSLESRVTAYQANLDGAIPYLTSRGISRETAERFRFGVNPDNNRLVIPYLSPAGPWTLKFRCILHDDCKPIHKDKYIYEPGSDIHLYNASTLLHAERVLVTEGEIDAVTAEQIGLHAVAYPGAEMWGKHKYWRWCFDSVDEVVVVGDGDDAGRKAAGTVTDSLRNSIHADVRAVVLPPGEDTNSFINNYGEYDFLAEIGWL